MAIRVEIAQVGRLRLEGEIRPVNDLAGAAEALDRRDPRVNDRNVDSGPGVPRIPPCLGTKDRRRVVHRIDILGWIIGRSGCGERGWHVGS